MLTDFTAGGSGMGVKVQKIWNYEFQNLDNLVDF